MEITFTTNKSECVTVDAERIAFYETFAEPNPHTRRLGILNQNSMAVYYIMREEEPSLLKQLDDAGLNLVELPRYIPTGPRVFAGGALAFTPKAEGITLVNKDLYTEVEVLPPPFFGGLNRLRRAAIAFGKHEIVVAGTRRSTIMKINNGARPNSASPN